MHASRHHCASCSWIARKAEICAKRSGIDVFLEPGPGAPHLANYLDAMRIAPDEFVPEPAARRHLVVPRHMVEPQQQVLRHLLPVREHRADLRVVLRGRVAALRPALETDAVLVRAVVVSRVPVGAIQVVHPRPRTVVMPGAHEVMQAERRHVVDHRLARTHHHRDHRLDERRIVAEGHAHPVDRDVARGCSRIPREPSVGVPVRLVEDRSRPVAIGADVGDTGHAGVFVAVQLSVDDFRDGRSLALRERVRVERLFEQRAQVREMRGESEIFLGDLEFHHERRLRHRAEQRMERLARLEIDRRRSSPARARCRRTCRRAARTRRTPAWRDRWAIRSNRRTRATSRRRRAERPPRRACSRRRHACACNPADPAGPRNSP